MNQDLVIGMNAAPRKTSYLAETLRSIRSQVDADVHIFYEPETKLPKPLPDFCHCHGNPERLGNFFNWINMARWLLDHTTSKWIMTVEDDVVFAKDAIPFALEICADYEPDDCGFFSLYKSARFNHAFRGTDGPLFQILPNVQPWGSCAWLFRRESVAPMLRHPIIRDWRGTTPERGLRDDTVDGIDIVVAVAYQAMSRKLFLFSPSLVQHIGADSAVGNNQGLTFGRTANDFNQDARLWTKPKPSPQ